VQGAEVAARERVGFVNSIFPVNEPFWLSGPSLCTPRPLDC
jgi:hypothetical protein